MEKLWLGIDIGGTSTRFLLLNQRGEWSGFSKIATVTWAETANPIATLAEKIVEVRADNNLQGIMLGLPGILNRQRDQVISLPFIPALNGLSVADLLADLLQIPVAMDKDVNHLMLWDLHQLPELPQSAVGLYLGTGMGNSLWIKGDFYHGAHGSSGEIGHTPLTHTDDVKHCPCGNSGCVETLTSGHWLTVWHQQNAPEIPLATLFSTHQHHPDLQAFIDRLAAVISGEMNIIDPQCLFLGGGVLAMADFPVATLRERIIRGLRPPLTKHNLQFIFSRATDQTGCRGACLAAQRRFGEGL